MKIIFLDIDGVLNHETFYQWRHEQMQKDGTFYDSMQNKWDADICLETVKRLNWLTDETGAKIVLSSTKRLGTSMEWLTGWFKRCNITGELIGRTPFLQIEESRGSVPRGVEIREWILNHKDLVGDEYRFTEYVILDDDSDMLYTQRNNFIKIDKYVGLTYGTAALAKHILDGHKIMNTNEL